MDCTLCYHFWLTNSTHLPFASVCGPTDWRVQQPNVRQRLLEEGTIKKKKKPHQGSFVTVGGAIQKNERKKNKGDGKSGVVTNNTETIVSLCWERRRGREENVGGRIQWGKEEWINI